MTRIHIENLRHIKKLNFEMPNPGLWILTGENGTGKTSLLAALRRIGYSLAFPVHFKSSLISDQLDSYSGAKITYSKGTDKVTYSYRTERWVPSPKDGQKFLRSLGYPAVKYVAADSRRIEPTNDDFSVRRARNAPEQVISALNQIFCTRKFDHLKVINTRRGVGNEAFLIELPTTSGKKKKYYSEKSFSLGELCMLRLSKTISEAPKKSLILVDEVELALHPIAQIELMKYLEKEAIARNLTIIVSTHSSTLIKSAAKARIIFLQKIQGDEVTCTVGCFPSYVLGSLAYQEEKLADRMIYVEDEKASIIVKEIINLTIDQKYGGPMPLRPTVAVVPVGGFTNVLRFFDRQKPLLSSNTKGFVILDADAQDSLENAQSEDLRQLYSTHQNIISFLPYTPEVGLLQYLDLQWINVRDQLRSHFGTSNIVMRRGDFSQIDANSSPEEQRSKAKSICKDIIVNYIDN